MVIDRELQSFSTETASKEIQSKSNAYSNNIVIRNIDVTQTSPLIVLLGWSNSKQRQLSRFSKIYEKIGCTTISVKIKLYKLIFSETRKFTEDSISCINAIKSQLEVNGNRAVLFHIFSLTGPAMYVNIMHYYHQFEGYLSLPKLVRSNAEEIIPNIRGVVYDSVLVEPISITTAENNFNRGVTNSCMLAVIGCLASAAFRYARANNELYTKSSVFLKKIPTILPQLMLYSKVDKIAPYKDIEEFIEYQRSLGASIQSKIWEDCAHLAHFRTYPKEYEDLITSFFEKSMSNYEDTKF